MLNVSLIQSISIQSLQNDNDNVDTHDQLIVFPIIIFSHGQALLHFHLYGGIYSEQHSHGCIVLAVECKDGSFILALKWVLCPGAQEGQHFYFTKIVMYVMTAVMSFK